jgi:dipeptidyl aminopeptidase/acylaminoacyl peptidase
VVATGNDFYSFPRVSPDGTRLAFTTWNHPNMPWDGTELWVAHLDRDGSLADPVHVAGGDNESVFQPQWSPDGVLHFVSDRRGWWNLYRLAGDRAEAVWEPDADLGAPQWVFGLSTYAFLSDGTIACARTERGSSSLVVLADGVPRDLGFGFGRGIHLSSDGQRLAFVAASPTRMPSVMLVDPQTAEADVLQRAASSELDERYVSVPETVEFPTEGGRTAHAWFYPPRNEDVEAPPEERPPLLVFSHGGPTGHVTNVLSPSIQFWTSRGFAVVDVNYGGSTGYGRAYRERLKRNWGVVDVDDCTAAARRLAGRGAVDADRLAIRGGSAGGYTTLAALAFRPGVFKAGANHFGVADLGMLARDTHKFESRYLDSLVGPYPETKDVYDARSPLVHADRIRTPLITLQGLEDVVVPPAQSEAIVEALRRNGVPCAYVPFPGEQHGFRRAENIARALEAELYFYGRVLGFEPADAIEPVEIENL